MCLRSCSTGVSRFHEVLESKQKQGHCLELGGLAIPMRLLLSRTMGSPDAYSQWSWLRVV